MRRISSWRMAPGRSLAARLSACGVALAGVAATLSVSACGGFQLCTSVLPAAPSASSVGSAVMTAKPAPDSTVMLPTGQQVRVSTGPAGQQSATPLGHGGGKAGAGYVNLRAGADQYLIPYDAVPYLGGALDPRLFDVSYLARLQSAGQHGASQHGASSHSATLPMTISASPGAAAVPLSAARAAKLGDQLASAFRAGKVTGAARLSGAWRVNPATPPAGVAAPAMLPGPAASAHPAGDLPRHTLTVSFTGTDGKPAAAIGWVQNLSNARYGTFFVLPPSYTSGITGTEGPLKFSVPEGNYSVQFTVITPDPGTFTGADAALVVEPQVSVDADKTVTLDARKTVPYQADTDTPVRSSGRMDMISYFRGSKTGGGCGTPETSLFLGLLSLTMPGVKPALLSASPVGQVTEGTLGFDASSSFGLTTNNDTGAWPAGPEYDLTFPYWGQIPGSLTFSVSDKEFAAVRQKLYANASSDCPLGNGERSIMGYDYLPWGDYQPLIGNEFWLSNPVTNGLSRQYPPGDYTDYLYTGDPKLTTWQLNQMSMNDCGGGTDNALMVWGPRIHTKPGEQITQTWDNGPGVPARTAMPVSVPQNMFVGPDGTGYVRLTADPGLRIAPAVRQDDNGMITLAPAGDSDLTHYGDASDYAGGQLSFYRNGTLAATGTVNPAGLDLPLLPEAATYRLDWTWANPLETAATTTTQWQFKSGPHDPRAKLPAGELCTPDPTRDCSLLPLLFLNYDLPLSMENQGAAGTPGAFGITVSSQEGAAVPTGVTVNYAASFDGGKTWTAARPAASTGGNRFAASIDVPQLASTDGFVALRVTATDGAGDSVTQTIIRAYGLTG